jgi:hypothetical protein
MKNVICVLLTLLVATIVQADDSIRLPWGTVVKISVFAVQPKWTEWFPQDNEFYAEKYADGNLKGMHSRHVGRLDGPSVTLHENGNLKILAFYPEGKRNGPFRVWDEDKHLQMYKKYQDDKNHGITCLLRDDTPWFVQEWEKGVLKNETVLVRKANDVVAIDDKEELAEAKKKLSALENELAESESELNKSMRKWFMSEQERVKKEKDKILDQVALAKHRAVQAASEKENSARTAAAHPYSSAGRAAGADARADAQHQKEFASNAKAVATAAQSKLSQMDKETADRSRQLYDFAMKALKKASTDGRK